MKFNKSKILYNKALNFIAGGVSSNFRLYEPAEVPLFFEKAFGSYMWDVDGNIYIKYHSNNELFNNIGDFISTSKSDKLDTLTILLI